MHTKQVVAPKLAPDQIIRNRQFLQHLTVLLHLSNDAALARALFVAPPVISKIRSGNLAVGAGTLLKVHECTGMTFLAMRAYLQQTA